MSGNITVNYEVIDQVVSDINRLSGQAKKYASLKSQISKSRGSSAESAKESVRLVSEYAKTLSKVLSNAAKSIADAKETMARADEEMARQFNTSSGSDSDDG